MTLDIDMVYTEVLSLNAIHNFVVNNIQIWDSLEAQIYVLSFYFKTQIIHFFRWPWM